ncbi:MAG: protein kinase [Chloroflexota bacterium]|nr:protein kinase [Chloroflexota bacterium]
MVCIQGPTTGKEFALQAAAETIGRAGDNRIVVDGMMISRHHAQVSLRNGQYVLVDLNSTNGVYVNGQRIAEWTLRSGDRIQIGDSVFVFQGGAQTEQPPPVRVAPTPPPAPPPARDLTTELRSYQITEKIGSGGSATVYKGVSVLTRTPVAIKILHTAADPFLQKKFVEEGKLGVALQHPHIARVFNYGEEDGLYFIVMEYVDGGSLRQRLEKHVPSSIDFVRAVIGQTCEALSYSHKHGVIHRDVKPENIMLSKQDRVKMVDFGIAKFTSAATKTSDGILICTPYYMSYEQAAGMPVVPASDIYSLGVVLYEMLTGEWPFTGEAMTVVHKHLTQKPVPPRHINSAISPQIETVVMRALEKDVRRRYQDTLEMARALGYQPEAPVEIPPPVPNLPTSPLPKQGPGQMPPPQVAPPSPRAGVPRLVVMLASARSKEIGLTQATVSLGRAEIDPNDIQISRQHLRLTQPGNQVWLEDAGSRNGTFVNGERILGRILLRPGNMIQVGNTMLRFEI